MPAGQAERLRPGPLLRGGNLVPSADGGVELSDLVRVLRTDAGRTWHLPAAELDATAREVTWPDGALGCPQPGHSYTQSLIPGWHVVVRSGDKHLVVHASRRGHWLMCPAGRLQSSERETMSR